ncbi:MAG: AmmeMemoRadiSam system radical SAM enzyme [Negativicutes bacterium]|nr:AmmeMemoRadiSam system radical SAM enzyme [Negativicutes bacterium]
MSRIRCPVCMHHCALDLGQTGLCKARRNELDKSVSINYGLLTSLALDPIEKKPLAFFHPGSKILSVGSFGCNLDCPFCQNDAISMAGIGQVRTEYYSPQRLAQLAQVLIPKDNIGVAYTYNEPMIGYEYVRDTAKEVRGLGLQNVLVTNGSVSAETLRQVLPYVDALNIDLKGFSEAYYRKLGGDLPTVLQFIRLAWQNAHVELTTLIVPGENDTEEEMRRLSAWVAELDDEIPLHITRFFPHRNRLDLQPTELGVLQKLAAVARKNLRYVLLGNV